ncbi:hypothetical protein I7I48_03620 [Histoplasma ohiense]|nr:hypothetical protein I7I48_03620 [Histoplasma ohiense (nom. inval.)]
MVSGDMAGQLEGNKLREAREVPLPLQGQLHFPPRLYIKHGFPPYPLFCFILFSCFLHSTFWFFVPCSGSWSEFVGFRSS